MQFEPIGFLQSCYPDKFGTPRQPGLVAHSWARLSLERKWQPEESLEGIEEFSHLWLIFVFHKNSNERFHAKVHPPRLEGRSIGLFATRSPHRPNPIGLSLVKLVRREGDSLILSGVDLIDGTPILDVKPYLPEVEAKTEATGGWTEHVDPRTVRVEWTQEQLEILSKWAGRLQLGAEPLRQLIEETLQLDPRPLVYRGYEGSDEAKYRQTHAVRFFDGDVHFRFLTPDRIQIDKVITPVPCN
jgi:tRNA-Thr(GGU) m(6)t(6)A37 methyltransferase TsaA